MKQSCLNLFSLFCMVTVNLILMLPEMALAYGTLSGYVRDNAGLPIDRAIVTSTEGSTFVTGPDGRYQLSHNPGTYTVTAAATGYSDSVFNSVTVADEQTTKLDFTLYGSPLSISGVYPSLGELGQDLEITITGTSFNEQTRVSMSPKLVNGNKVIGSIDTPDYALDVAVAGNNAYVADGESGLLVIDIDDPTWPFVIGSVDTPGNTSSVMVQGDMAYMTDSVNGLQIIDISDPTHPTMINTDPLYTPINANAVSVVGNTAYIADNYGLLVIDVSDPSSPSLSGWTYTPGYAQAVTVAGSTAYIADNESGLQVFDISDPTDPAIIGSVDTPGNAVAVTVAGNTAYIADYESGLQVIDISDPANPFIIGSVDTPGEAWDVAVDGNTAYVTDGLRDLQVIDISDSASPTIIGLVDTSGYANSVTLAGSTAYVADGLDGLQVIDVFAPTNPTMIGYADTPWAAKDLAITGNTAYVADHKGGLQVIDISDHTNPSIIGSLDNLDTNFDLDAFLAVTVVGSTAYVADDLYGLLVIDVSDPTSPTLTGWADTPGFNAQDVTVAGNIAYLVESRTFSGEGEDSLQVIDISDPANPVIIGSVYTPGYRNNSVTVVGNTVYVGDSYGLHVIDISDPTNPSITGWGGTSSFAEDIAVVGDYAYVATFGEGLEILDVSNPASPNVTGSIVTPGYSESVSVVGNTAYLADGESGLQVIDISDPANPVIIASIDTPDSAQDVLVIGGTAYLADRFRGFEIIPIPAEINTVTMQSNTEIIATLPSPPVNGHYTIRVFNGTESHELPGAVTFTDEIKLLSSRAIIVAGGGPHAEGEIWEETRAYANNAYDKLIYQGYRQEDIIYLTDEVGAPGSTGEATKTELEAAISSANTGDLLLYLVDHGENERFLLRGGDIPEYVTAAEIGSLLNDLQTSYPGGKVIVIYDGCRSGSFISRLSPPAGEQRVTVTSSTPDQATYFINNNHSFSAHFWSTLSGKSGNKANLFEAFERAATNMAPYQTAQLDANGNGFPNEDEDFATLKGFAGNIYALRRQYADSRHSKPVVALISGDQTLSGTGSAPLMARSVYDLDGDAITSVWAEIIAPDSVPDAGQTVNEVTTVELFDPELDGVYEANYNGFTVQGWYIINYYTKDARGIHSLPKTSLVRQTSGATPIPPDNYEPDNSADDAQIITLNYPTPQYHSFHVAGDEDWVQFYGIQGEYYNFKAENPSILCDPVIQVYGSDGSTQLAVSNSSGAGVTEKLTDWECPANGIYYVRLSNDNGRFGANVNYELKVYNPFAFSLPGYVTGTVTSGSTAVGGAVLVSGGGSSISQPDGSYLLSLEEGSHAVSVSKTGYLPASFTVGVASGDSSYKNVSLVPAPNTPPVISGTPPISINTNELYTFTPTASDPDSDTLMFSVNGLPAWAGFSTANGTIAGLPNESHIGTHGPIWITVSDSQAQTSLPEFFITVNPGSNRPPVISGSPPGMAGADRMFSFVPTCSDPNGDQLTFSVSGKPSWATFSIDTGRLSGIPGDANIGKHGPVSITARDPFGASSSINFDISVVPGSEINKFGVLQGVYLLLRE